MDNIIITTLTSSSPEYPEVYDLREEVLRKPLGLSLKNEDLSRDHTDTIMACKSGGKVIACLMLHHKDAGTMQLRQMAVAPEWQGKGVGRMLVQAAEAHTASAGYRKMILHARKTAMGFYGSMDYKVTGDEFSEVGIAHYIMEKEMAAAG